VLALSSLSFDLSVYDIFGPLAAGGAVVVPNASARPDPQHWAEVARRERVTIWNSVPALMDILVEHLRDRGERLPEGLRVVMLSGDWVPVGLPGQIKSLAEGGVEVYSLGGATEASIWSIIYPVGEVDPGWKSIPYGKPMANQSWQVLNEWLEPCPVWTPGQLHIGGVGVAKGYWRDEEKTGRSFITHPRTGERLYRTGDLGRYLPDGNIEFLGREDSQVKVQGYRIELGEIETTLEEYEGVRAAAVLAAGEPRGNKRLAAFVVPAPGAAPAANELQDYLRGKLPDYMVPASFTFLDALPLTPNGKVDRRALAAPELARSGMGREYVAPRTPLEETLAKIFADTLQLERVGIHDNFFELGGHSLLATQVVSRVREALRVEVTLRDMFDKPTVEKLSEVTEQAMVAALQSRLASHARVTRPA
jgi:acyl-coenzyme A synthetase/AMP-(fatty) acid ligase/acyl carrier protein